MRWKAPEEKIENIQRLAFARLKFRGDPDRPADAAELVEQAAALGRIVTDARYYEEFGLISPNAPVPNGDRVELPWVESVRSSRRVGPDGQVLFDLVAEVAQRRWVRPRASCGAGGKTGGGPALEFFGGATVIVGPEGDVRYVIRKSILSNGRVERQRQFALAAGRQYWRRDGTKLVRGRNLFALLHEHAWRARTEEVAL